MHFLPHVYENNICRLFLTVLCWAPKKSCTRPSPWKCIPAPPEDRIFSFTTLPGPPARELNHTRTRLPRVILKKTFPARPSPRGPAGPAGQSPWTAHLWCILSLNTHRFFKAFEWKLWTTIDRSNHRTSRYKDCFLFSWIHLTRLYSRLSTTA